jgi:cell cycle sensor histidine kinase DivJ
MPGLPDRAAAWLWHAVWAGLVGAAAVGLVLLGGADLPWRIAALGSAALPGLAGCLLLAGRRDRNRALLLALWGFSAAGACLLAGGLTGPFAVLSLAPVAAAAALGGGRRLAEGGALVVIALAVTALAQLSGLAGPQPPAQAAFWMSLTALSILALALAGGLLVARQRTAMIQALREADTEWLERVLSAAPGLLAALDGAGQALALHGHTPTGVSVEVLRNGGLAAAAIEPDRVRVEGAVALARLEGYSEVEFAPAGAPELTLAASLRRGSDGVIVLFLRDASAEKAREAGLEHARAEAETAAAGRARFLAEMSHELRTPLNAIMGFSDVMRGRLFGPLSDRYTEYAQLIHESGAHLLDLINDILDMSKIEADRYQLSLEDFDAREAVSAALRLMRVQADAAGVQLRGVLPPGPLEVRADRRAVKQIALNLLANALKFTPHGGQVTVTAQGSGDTLELVVADTGIGIAPDDLERLGRPYEQAGDPAQNARGTGLGLSLVRAFAGLHGGELSIESVLGEGATFSVRLPVLIRAGAARLPADPSLLGDNVVAFNPQR